MRHSSAGEGRRGSVDSDGDMLDEVAEIGAPWEPAFDRRPPGVDALDWMIVRNVTIYPTTQILGYFFCSISYLFPGIFS